MCRAQNNKLNKASLQTAVVMKVISLTLMVALVPTLQGCAVKIMCEEKETAAFHVGGNECLNPNGDFKDECDSNPTKWCWAGEENNILCMKGGGCLVADEDDPFTTVNWGMTLESQEKKKNRAKWTYDNHSFFLISKAFPGPSKCLGKRDTEAMLVPLWECSKIYFLPTDGQKSCDCDNGVPDAGSACLVHGDIACSSCYTGYHHEGSECKENVCECEYGVAARGSHCQVHGEKMCSSCPHENFELQGLVCSCPSGYRIEGSACKENVCSCQRGEAARGGRCPEHGAVMCTTCDNGLNLVGSDCSCPAGYRLEDSKCKENICTCDGGVAATGSECQVHGIVACSSCGENYQSNGTDCICPFGYRLEGPECKENICRCEGGVGDRGSNCQVHGAVKCSSCDENYKLSGMDCICADGYHNEGSQCNENVCICEHGVPARGSQCPEHDKVMCLSCSDGYALDGPDCAHFPRCKCNADNSTRGAFMCNTEGDEPCRNADWACAQNKSLGLCLVGGLSGCHAISAFRDTPQIAAQCSALASEEACDQQPACEWFPPKIPVWKCANPQHVDLGCNQYNSYDECIALYGCNWELFQEQICGLGEWVPCRGHSACSTFKTPDDCETQLACQWYSSDSCQCPDTHFGEYCQTNLSKWESHSGLCLQDKADLDRCNALTYWSYWRDNSAGACQGNSYCSEWSEIRDSLTRMHFSSVLDLSVDSVGFVFTLIFGTLALCIADIDTPLLTDLYRVSVMMMAVTFMCDIFAQAYFLTAANKIEKPIKHYVDSFCFSQGSGYEAIVAVREKFTETRRNSLIMILVAVAGMLSELGQFALSKPDRKEMMITLKTLIVVSCICNPFELFFGVFDFTVNTMELINGVEAIESAVLGIKSLENGFVCVSLDESLKSGLKSEDVVIASAAGLVVLLVLSCSTVISCFCLCCSRVFSRVDPREHTLTVIIPG